MRRTDEIFPSPETATLPDHDPRLPRVGLGRCEGEGRLGRYLDSLDANEETGDVDGPGHYRLLRLNGPEENARREETYKASDLPYSYRSVAILSESEAETLASLVGAILRTSGDGFVYCETYTSNAELQGAWDDIADTVATFYADEGEEA